jgi:hypothetical protein
MFGLFKAIKHGLIDGWNGTNQYTHLYYKIPEPEAHDQNILDEITTLEIIVERQYIIGAILDKELNNTSDNRKKAILLNKLNVLDKQTLNNVKKLNKLKDMV